MKPHLLSLGLILFVAFFTGCAGPTTRQATMDNSRPPGLQLLIGEAPSKLIIRADEISEAFA